MRTVADPPDRRALAREQVARGLDAQRRGDFAAAQAAYLAVLQAIPDYFDALHLMGTLHLTAKAYADAIRWLERAVAVNATVPRAHFNLGLAYLGHNNPLGALTVLERALVLKPDYPEALNSYGSALLELGREHEAAAALHRCLELRPDHVPTLGNYARALYRVNWLSEVCRRCEQLFALDPGQTPFRGLYAMALLRLGRVDEAEQQMALGGPEHVAGFVHGHLRQRLCDWSEIDAFRSRLAAWDVGRDGVVDPFVLLAAVDDPQLQQRAARAFCASILPRGTGQAPRPEAPRNKRLRIAYLSADFCNHATSILSVGLFEQHDRSAVEVLGVSYGRQDGSPLERRVHASFDRMLDARALSDAAIAERLRQERVDVVIDVKGITSESRLGILAERPAAVQVSYLAFPGTLGTPCVDYLVTDEFVVPAEARSHYDERIVYVPDSYQVNDSKRAPAGAPPPRTLFGLPQEGFVFASFNNTFKILPEIFDAWMRLLRAVPGSTLWLLGDNDGATRNLRREAGARGVAPERLVFAPRVLVDEHLARQRNADLFLDTFPCNAHTTASDALWAGVPVVTLAGRGFAARVAGSVLRAAGLPELVTHNLGDYEALALSLARDPARLAELKQRLATSGRTAPLFDTARIARYLEAAYAEMARCAREGLPAASFRVLREGTIEPLE